MDTIDIFLKQIRGKTRNFFQLPDRQKMKMNLIAALKIGLGSALAIFIAYLLHLPNAASAGTIALLTIMAQTRRQTLTLIGRRFLSYIMTVGLCFLIFPTISNIYLSYALFLIVTVFVLELLGWQTTLSVNAVIGAHFLINQDFSLAFVGYEFGLLCIGIAVALLMNLIQPDASIHEDLYKRVLRIEENMRESLLEISDWLTDENKKDFSRRHVLPDLRANLLESVETASWYAQNSFSENDECYLRYFELRLEQYALLHELYEHAAEIKELHECGVIISEYIASLASHVSQATDPDILLTENDELKKRLALAEEEQITFEEKAMLLFLLYDLQEFVTLKREFLNHLTPGQRELFEKYQFVHPKKKLLHPGTWINC